MPSVLPKAVTQLAAELTRLPSIGPKTAQRLAIHLLRQPFPVVSQLANSIKNLHANVRICRVCFNLADADLCRVCRDDARDRTVVCVVEEALDVEAIEKTGTFQGVYHVLGGVLSPLDGIGPDQLNLSQLFERLTRDEVKELIIALDHNLESEATIRYVMERLADRAMTITRLARGLPTGGDIEFADSLTLSAAFQGRRKL